MGTGCPPAGLQGYFHVRLGSEKPGADAMPLAGDPAQARTIPIGVHPEIGSPNADVEDQSCGGRRCIAGAIHCCLISAAGRAGAPDASIQAPSTRSVVLTVCACTVLSGSSHVTCRPSACSRRECFFIRSQSLSAGVLNILRKFDITNGLGSAVVCFRAGISCHARYRR